LTHGFASRLTSPGVVMLPAFFACGTAPCVHMAKARPPPSAIESERAKLYAFLVGPGSSSCIVGKPRGQSRSWLLWTPVRIPNDALLSRTRRRRVWGKAKPPVPASTADGFAVCRAVIRFVCDPWSVFDLNQIIMPPELISSFPRRLRRNRHEVRGFSPSCCCCTRHRVRDCCVIIRGLRVRWKLSALSSAPIKQE